jgi:PAS domain S-box-containing protein
MATARHTGDTAGQPALDAQYRMLVENSADVVFHSVEGVLEWISPAVTALAGWAPEEIIGTSPESYWHPDDLAAAVAARDAAFDGKSRRMVGRLRAKDGHYIWIEASVRPYVGEDGRREIVGALRDVTAQKQLERELRESREEYRLLAENSADVILRVGADHMILWASPSTKATLGWEPEHLVGHATEEFIHPDERAEYLAAVREVVSGERPPLISAPFRCADGTYRRVEGRSREMVGPDGSLSFVVGLRDIEDEAKARAALASSQAQLRATLDGMLDPHVLLRPLRDAEGTIVDFVYVDGNRAACTYLRMERDQLIGQRLLGIRSGETGEWMLAQCAAAMTSGEPLVLDGARPIGPDPSGRRFDIHAVPIGGDLSFTWRDVTEWHQAARRLAESEERYRLLAENAVDVVFVVTDGIPTWVSPSVTQVMGCRPEDLIGQPADAWVHPDDLAAVQAAVQAAQAGAEQRFEVRLRSGEGAYRWMSAVTRPIRDASGAMASASCCMRDVQAEVEARTALERSEQLLRHTLDSLLDPHVTLRALRDPAGHIVDFEYLDANPAACEYNGVSREQLVGARLLDMLPGHLASGLLAMYAAAVENGEPLILDDFAYEQELLGGPPRRYEVRAVRVAADTLSYSWRDVTSRFEANEAIRRRVSELATLQRLAELLVLRVNLDEALDSACRLLEEILALERAEVRLLSTEGAPGEGAPGEGAPGHEPETWAAVDASLATDAPVAVDVQSGDRLLRVPLRAHKQMLGALLLRRRAGEESFGPAEQSLAQTAADLLAAVTWIERLHVEEVKQAASAERRRIARDLHDAVTQTIHAAAMLAESLPIIYERDVVQGREDLLTIRRLIRAAFAELRILLYELRPETLATAPLEVVFGRLRDALVGRGETEADLSVEQGLDLPQDVRTAFDRVAQEALSNVAKHAHATHVTVELAHDGADLRLMVRDDGCGFNPAATPPGFGRSTMRERASAIGAELRLESIPGAGSTVTMVWRPA